MPILEAAPCWRRFAEFDTSVAGITWLLYAFAQINRLDCEANPALREELFARCNAVLAGLESGEGTKRIVHGEHEEREVWIPGHMPGTGVKKRFREPWAPSALPKGAKLETSDGKTSIVRNGTKVAEIVRDPEGKKWMVSERWVPPIAPFIYEDEPVDKWCSFSVMAERSPKQSILADCDCLTPVWACFFHLRFKEQGKKNARAGVAITQPRTKCCACRHSHGKECTAQGPKCKRCGYGMAHAYTVIDEGQGVEVFDGSVLGGMHDPAADFYGSGETKVLWLTDEIGGKP